MRTGAGAYSAYPSSAFGYWRGVGSDGPLAYGQGSNYGQASQGAGMFPDGYGPPAAASGGWHPTVIYLLILIAAEMIAFKLIAAALR